MAERVWELAPGRTIRSPRAWFDDADLSKVTGLAPPATFEGQFKLANGGEFEHPPTLAYRLRDITLSGRWLAAPAWLRAESWDEPVPMLTKVVQEIDDAVLASTVFGHRYFGHWLHDDLAILLAARELGRPVVAWDNRYPSQAGYLAALGLAVECVEHCRFRRLTLIDDRTQNAYRVERYAALRNLALQRHGDSASRTRCVYVRRTGGVRRDLLNEDELAEMVTDLGFAVMDPMLQSPEQIIRTCLNAELVLGVEGSHLANGFMWMQPSGTLLVLQPPNHFNMFFKYMSDARGGRFAFLVGDPAVDGFTVNRDRLRHALEALLGGAR